MFSSTTPDGHMYVTHMYIHINTHHMITYTLVLCRDIQYAVILHSNTQKTQTRYHINFTRRRAACSPIVTSQSLNVHLQAHGEAVGLLAGSGGDEH